MGACSGKKQMPEDILSPADMTRVLIQVHMLEARVNTLGLRRDTAAVVYAHFHNLMLEKMEVDSATFNRSFDYYSKEPPLFLKVYNAVVDSLISYETREKMEMEEAPDTLKVEAPEPMGIPSSDDPDAVTRSTAIRDSLRKTTPRFQRQ